MCAYLIQHSRREKRSIHLFFYLFVTHIKGHVLKCLIVFAVIQTRHYKHSCTHSNTQNTHNCSNLKQIASFSANWPSETTWNRSSATVNRAEHLYVEDTCQPWDNVNFIQPVVSATGYCCIPAKSTQFSFFLLSSSVVSVLHRNTQIQARFKWPECTF